MTEQDLAAIEALANAATPGPWRHQTAANADAPDDYGAVKVGGTLLIDDAPDADCAFVCAARDAVPALVAEVRRLRGLVEAAYREGQTNEFAIDSYTTPIEWEQSDACKALDADKTPQDGVS